MQVFHFNLNLVSCVDCCIDYVLCCLDLAFGVFSFSLRGGVECWEEPG